jgi:teichoic acid transport system permease protein
MTTTESPADSGETADDVVVEADTAGDDGTPSAPPEPFEVYERTRTGIPPLRRYFGGVWKRMPFVWHQARSDMKAENYDTVLGQVWLVINPILIAAVFIFGRSILRPLGSPEERDYLISHLIMAIFFYQYVASSLQSGAKAIVSNKRMILNTSFPRAVFPIANGVKAIFDFLPLLAVLFVVRVILNQPFGWNLLWLPLVFLLMTIFAMGLTFLCATITVYFRDFTNVVSNTTRLWLWATPILYTTEEIPEGIKPYLELNPLYPFYAALEQIFQNQMPSPIYLLWGAAWAIPTLALGLVVFMRKEREFAVRF